MKKDTFFNHYYTNIGQCIADLLITSVASGTVWLAFDSKGWILSMIILFAYWVVRFSRLSVNGKNYFSGLLAAVLLLEVAYILQPTPFSFLSLVLLLPLILLLQNKLSILSAGAVVLLFLGISYAYPQVGTWTLKGVTQLMFFIVTTYLVLLSMIAAFFENQLKRQDLLRAQLSSATEQIAMNIMMAREIASGVYREETELATDELGKTLKAMGISIQTIQEEDELRRWQIESLQELSEIIRSMKDEEQLPSRIMKSLIKNLDAHQGGIYIAELSENSKETRERLVLRGSYAYNQEKIDTPVIEAGEGMLGQAYLGREIIHLQKLPNNYITVSSGLGEVTPQTLIIVPIIQDNQTVGVLEIASLHSLKEYQVEFLKKTSQIIASAVLSSRANEQIRELLRNSQQLTEELLSHDEEMRQNLEELSAMQDNLERAHAEINKSKEFLDLVIDNINDPLFVKNRKHEFVMVNEAYCDFMGYKREFLLGKTALDIFGAEKGQRFVNEEENLFIKRIPSIIEDEITTVGKGTKAYLKRKVIVEDGNENLFLVGLLTDITEMANLRKKLSE